MRIICIILWWGGGVLGNRRCPPVKLIALWEKVDISLVYQIERVRESYGIIR